MSPTERQRRLGYPGPTGRTRPWGGETVNRRHLLKSVTLGGLILGSMPLLEACGPAAPAAPAKPAETAKPANTNQPAGQPVAKTVAAGAPKRGGQLNIVVQNDWVTFDPPFNTAEPNGSNMIFGSWMNWLPDASGSWGPRPDMVAEWDAKPDSLTVKLQSGIKFHDGTAWDAKAAKWNLDRLIFHPASGLRANMRGVDVATEDQAALDKLKAEPNGPFTFQSKVVEAVDDRTVKIRLSTPNASIVSSLSGTGAAPVSPDAYNKVGKDASGLTGAAPLPLRLPTIHAIGRDKPIFTQNGKAHVLTPVT